VNFIDRHDGRVSENDRRTRRRLRLKAGVVEQEGCGAGAGTGKQLPAANVRWAAGGQ
jgi:hypothetical protein